MEAIQENTFQAVWQILREEEIMYSKVLVPLNGSQSSEKAMAEVKNLAPAIQGVQLVLIEEMKFLRARRFDTHTVYVDQYVEIRRKDGMEYLRPFVEDMNAIGLEASASVKFGDVIPVIKKAVDEYGVDLIVLGGGEGGWLEYPPSLSKFAPRLSRQVDARIMVAGDGQKAA